MPNKIRIKRRAAGGAAGAPLSLENAELAFNEQDGTLYYGTGTGGAGGTATQVIAIGGAGAFVPVAHVGSGGASHATAVASGAAGFMSGADKSKLDGVAVGATNYAHPTGDGNLHVPATSTTNNGRVLTAGATAGVLSWTAPLVLTAATPAALGTAAAGVATDAAKSDHVHAMPSAANVGAMATGHAANAITGFGASAANLGVSAAGAAGTVSRSDHVHALPTLNALGLPTADVALNGFKISGLAEPVGAQDAATKNYVDNSIQGLDPKGSVRAATIASITLSGAQTVDGVALVAGDRVLVKDQTAPAENGIYVVAAGAWVRASDNDVWAEFLGAYVFAESGTINAENGFVCTNDPGGTLGSTGVVFQQFSGAGQITAGTGLLKTGNTLSVLMASAGTLGGIKVGTGLTIDGAGVLAAAGSVTNLAQGTRTTTTVPVTSSTGTSATLDIATATLAGVMSSADKTKLDGIAAGANNYVHPTGDGNQHVPATGTINNNNVLVAGATAGSSAWAPFSLATHTTGTLAAAKGGTGLVSYAVGDLVFASAATTLASLADVAVGSVLISGGVGVAPAYGKVGLASHVSGILPVANGGIGGTTSTGTGAVVLSTSPILVTPTLGTPNSGNLASCTFPTLNQNTTGFAASLAGGLVGQIPYQSAVNATAMLVAGTAGQVLVAQGAAAPAWVSGYLTDASTLDGGTF